MACWSDCLEDSDNKIKYSRASVKKSVNYSNRLIIKKKSLVKTRLCIKRIVNQLIIVTISAAITVVPATAFVITAAAFFKAAATAAVAEASFLEATAARVTFLFV